MEWEFVGHKIDIMSDYIFFGQTFRWQPSEVDNMGWSVRKEIKQGYLDYHQNEAKK